MPVAFAAAIAAKRFAKPLQPFAPYPGVAAANALGCLAMRKADYEEGVPVRPAIDPSGEALGASRAAGWAAVRDTALTRLVLPLGNFVGVPLILGGLSRLGGARPPIVAQVGVTAAVFSLWMPVGASMFPPTGRLNVAEVEGELAARAPQGCAAVVYERGA